MSDLMIPYASDHQKDVAYMKWSDARDEKVFKACIWAGVFVLGYLVAHADMLEKGASYVCGH